MGDFSVFYENGGVFMHFITVTGAAALTALLLHARSRRLRIEGDELLRVADRLAGIGVALGMIGTLFGLMDLGAALNMVDPAEFGTAKLIQAGARGLAIAGTTLAWGLMVAVPIRLVTTFRAMRLLARPA